MLTQKKNEVMNLTVTEGLTVSIIPSSDHEYLIPSTDVAIGYGISRTTLRRHLQEHGDELNEGKHFIKGVHILNTLVKGVQPNTTFWTKRGIVRLGFFIKSERARRFRDWAEDLVIATVTGRTSPSIPLQRGTSLHQVHGGFNRLTPARLVDLLADVCLVDDPDLRQRLVNKLTGRAAL